MELTKWKNKDISSWNAILLENFAATLGASLDALEREYDDMIKTFELQTVQLQKFVKYEKPKTDEPLTIERSPSPAPSDSSRSSIAKKPDKRRTKIQSSFRVARKNFRKKISSRTMSPCPHAVLKSENSGSKPSLMSRNDSEHNFSLGANVYERRESQQ